MIAPGERASPSEPTTDGHGVSRVDVSPCAGDSPSVQGQQLLAEFIRYGRQRPFEEIVRRYAGMVFNVCYRVTKDKHDAEDATQAVFLTLAVQAKRGAEIKALGPWLQQVAKRLSLDVKRGQKRRKTREEKHQDEQTRRRTAIDEESLDAPDLEELKLILHEELQKLPAKYRLPLILHYFGGMTRDEMAAELNCKPSTLGVRIFRGREMLAGRLNGRGVHLSAGAMALAIGYLVKQTITGSMVARTSQAAAALASGSADFTTVGHLMASHAGSAEAAARVIGLTRRASHVLVIGKVRVTVAIALLAGTSLGAGVKAFAMLPSVSMSGVRQMISDGVSRLIQPLIDPLTRPIHADATPAPSPSIVLPIAPMVVAGNVGGGVAPPIPRMPASTSTPASTLAMGPTRSTESTTGGGGVPRPEAGGDLFAVASPVATALERTVAAASVAGDATATSIAAHHGSDAESPRPTTPPLLAIGGNSGATGNQSIATGGSSGMTASAANDLYVPAGNGTSVYALGGSAASNQIIQVPAIGGSVSASNGVVRGYGRIDRTGTLSVSGKVVADGNGIDRTLDLTGFTKVTTATTGATPTGFYAADHGRLSLALAGAPASTSVAASVSSTVSSTVVGPTTPMTAVAPGTTIVATIPAQSTADTVSDTVLTWGADPSSTTLTPVNSVRMTLHGGTVPTALSLLSPDRSDAPSIPAADGSPIGLWEIDPLGTPLSAVDLLVRYDDHLVSLLGADESDVRLWTLGGLGSGWQSVSDATFSLDLSDHIVGGTASDVCYFAVTVPAAADLDASEIIAHPAAELAPLPPAGAVPEPTAIGAVAIAAMATLGRRRRNSPPAL